MYCSNCGKEINDNSTYCPYCGAKVGAETNPVYYAPVEDRIPVTKNTSNNILAIISMILSGIGFFIFPLIFSTAGLITGIAGYNVAVSKLEGRGKKLSIWAIIIGAIGLAYGIIHFLVVYMGG